MFVIDGVWKLTAERTSLKIEARDEEQALAYARSRGLIPLEIRPAADVPAQPTECPRA